MSNFVLSDFIIYKSCFTLIIIINNRHFLVYRPIRTNGSLDLLLFQRLVQQQKFQEKRISEISKSSKKGIEYKSDVILVETSRRFAERIHRIRLRHLWNHHCQCNLVLETKTKIGDGSGRSGNGIWRNWRKSCGRRDFKWWRGKKGTLNDPKISLFRFWKDIEVINNCFLHINDICLPSSVSVNICSSVISVCTGRGNVQPAGHIQPAKDLNVARE